MRTGGQLTRLIGGFGVLALLTMIGSVLPVSAQNTRLTAIAKWTSERLPTPDRSGRWFVAEAVACPAVSSCHVAGDTFTPWSGNPAVDTLANGKWTTREFVAPGSPQATITNTLTCPRSASFCVGGGSGGPGDNLANGYSTAYLLMRSGVSWAVNTAPLPPANLGGGAIVDASCVGPRLCVAVGYDFSYYGSGASLGWTAHGLIETYAHGTWTPRQAPLAHGQSDKADAYLGRVFCQRAGKCVAIGAGDPNDGQSIVLTLAAGRWMARRPPTPRGVRRAYDIQLDDVACPVFGPCAIVGSYTTRSHGVTTVHPLFLSQTATGWRASTVRNGQYAFLVPRRVACPSARFCVAAGVASSADLAYLAGFTRSRGRWASTVLPYGRTNLGTWQAAEQSYGISGLACASAGSCMAVGLGNQYQLVGAGNGGRSLAYSSGRWTAERIPNPPGVPRTRPLGVVGVAVRGRGYIAVGDYSTGNQAYQKGMVAFYPGGVSPAR